MRAEDYERFIRPYELDETADDPTADGFARAAGVALPNVDALVVTIKGDRDPSLGGIGWWAPHPGTRRRILITDHLLRCLESVKTNLVEAQLHQFEHSDYTQRQSDFMANSVRVERGAVRLDLPRRTSGVHDLPNKLAAMHCAGFFRSIGSAIDCLAAGIIGVAALPTNLLRADLTRALKAADRYSGTRPFAGDLVAQVGDAADASGPHGWLPWTTDYRNMLVHRGRRWEFSQFLRRRPVLLGPDGNEIVRMDVVEQLAQDPARSDVEALLAMAWEPAKDRGAAVAPVLEEAATTTMAGVAQSAGQFIESVCDLLRRVWDERRSDPELVRQPLEQWPEVPSTPPRSFDGYARGEVEFSVDTIVLNPSDTDRLEAALFGGNYAERWDAID